MAAQCGCGREGFYLRPHSGEVLCKKCLIRSVERTTIKTVHRENLFSPKDKIMIALSGGKDSVALTHLLSRIERRHLTSLVAVTIDEGLKGYRDEGLSISRKVCEKLELTHKVVTFKDFYGHTLEEIYKLAEERNAGLLGCTFCGILRRRLLNETAIDIGATKVATGHNLDDEAQTAFINVIRGDISRLARLGTKPAKPREGFVPRVKPLRYIPEREIALYVFAKGYPLYERECPFVRESLRDEVRDILNNIEAKHPGTKFSVVRGVDRLSEALKANVEQSEIGSCAKCGSPTGRKICRTCEVLGMLGLNGNYINHLAE
jgi:uncharacterized protein (TIGR00269 family)